MSSTTKFQFPIKFCSNFVRTKRETVFVRHTIDEDDFLLHYCNEVNDTTPEFIQEVKTKWNALSKEQQQEVIDNFIENQPFTMNDHHDVYQEDNHIECYDEDDGNDDSETFYSEADLDNDLADDIQKDLYANQSSTVDLLDTLFSTPAEQQAKKIERLERLIKDIDERFVSKAEALKEDFMKKMGLNRKETEAEKDKLRKELNEIKDAQLILEAKTGGAGV